jgi:Ca2+-binding RTX toxin-like protein
MSTAFRISLDGAQETPSVDTDASGLGTAIYDSKAGTLSYVLYITGLDFGEFAGGAAQTADPGDDVTGAHFHNAVRGAPGPIVLDLTGDGDFKVTILADGSARIEGVWDSGDSGNSLAAFVAALQSALVGADIPLYLNIHTDDNGGGEIRGQLVGLSTDQGETVDGTPGDDILPGLGGNDVVNGLAGEDLLDGGKGKDMLNGGPEADIFRFSTKLNAKKNVDKIADFTDEDLFHLDDADFKKLKPGALKQKAFYEGDGAHDANDRIILDGRKLFYDKNGDKDGGDTVFAKVGKGVDVGAEHFFVV